MVETVIVAWSNRIWVRANNSLPRPLNPSILLGVTQLGRLV